MTNLERTTFEMPRASEYFDVTELQKMTGLSRARFGEVAIKELMDNALDACESAGVPPEVSLHTKEVDADTLCIIVEDNGNGILPDTVRRILNFQTRTSDKAVYRAPTRGLQGNALKTLLGMPFALGVDQPVVVEAHGIRHLIKAWTDPAGELRINHEEASGRSQGTLVGLPLPKVYYPPNVPWWGKAFALFNPHALVQIRNVRDASYHANIGHHENSDLYQMHHPTVQFPKPWRKFLPTDFTSPWWYDTAALQRLVFSHIAAANHGGRDLTLREFVRQFRGLTPTRAAKKVCSYFTNIPRLRSFEDHPELVVDLLKTMQEHSNPPTPNVLGLVGSDHFRAKFEEWYGVKRWWYKKESGMDGAIPFTVEVAIAETEREGDIFYGSNFSPTLDTPIQTRLECKEFDAFGIDAFLQRGYSYPLPGRYLAVAFHLTAPVLETLDRGKSRIQVTPKMAETIGRVLWEAIKVLYREGKARERDVARASRDRGKVIQANERQERADRISLKEAAFAVLEDAFEAASGGGQYPVSVRTLYYQVRPRVQAYNTGRELDFNYFSQNLMQDYQRIQGTLPGLYYEPRGILYEPHSDSRLELGTREVADYHFPSWTFNKILYVEKQGLWPVLRQARLGERHDMGIVAGQGYATEAKTIFQRDFGSTSRYQRSRGPEAQARLSLSPARRRLPQG